MAKRKRRGAATLPGMMAALAVTSWETIARRTLMIAQGRCSAAEYRRMVGEKVAAAQQTAAVLTGSQGRCGGAEILAVVYQPGLQTVEVRQGDNRGQAVRHVNVVRDVVRLGDWRGRPALFDLPVSAEGQGVVILIQAKGDRRILGAAVRK